MASGPSSTRLHPADWDELVLTLHSPLTCASSLGISPFRRALQPLASVAAFFTPSFLIWPKRYLALHRQPNGHSPHRRSLAAPPSSFSFCSLTCGPPWLYSVTRAISSCGEHAPGEGATTSLARHGSNEGANVRHAWEGTCVRESHLAHTRCIADGLQADMA